MNAKAFFYIYEAPQNALGYIMSRLWKKRLITLNQREVEHLYGLENLLQSMLGFVVKIYVADYYSHRKDKVLSSLSGFSMGKYICLNSAHDLETLRHEIGHCVQSRHWGWLYLPVIGLYSAIACNWWDRTFHKSWNPYDRHYWYYITRWTERGADKHGKVNRKAKLARIHRPENSRFPVVL